jgi:hypothetical protein
VKNHFCNFCSEKWLVFAHRLDRREQVAPCVSFQDIAASAGLKNFADQFFRFVHG